MNAININPLVVSVSYTSVATSLHPIYPTEHGGAIKKVVAVVVHVIIPIEFKPFVKVGAPLQFSFVIWFALILDILIIWECPYT